MSISSQEAIDTASNFLAPVLNKEKIQAVKATSVVDRLTGSLKNEELDGLSPRHAVIRKALNLLRQLHEVLVREAGEGSNTTPVAETSDVLYDPHSKRVIYGLLDLVSLEGIYPALSPGVGIPLERRVKSILQAGVTTREPISETRDEENAEDRELLKEITETLIKLQRNDHQGLDPILKDRGLTDLISACLELAYGPAYHGDPTRNRNIQALEALLDNTPTMILFPILTSLLTPTTPAWLKSRITKPLSLLPLRPSGIRQLIDFMASTAPLPPTTNPKDSSSISPALPSQGPTLPMESLQQVSRLLGSVPSSLTQDAYFDGLAPQLFALLDGEAGPEMSKTAGIVIGSLLGRKQIGAPGQPGWKALLEPILRNINPPLIPIDDRLQSHKSQASNSVDSSIVTEADYVLALKRLQVLIASHPNPSLAQRTLKPLLLPLWGLLCYARSSSKTNWHEAARSLIETFLKVSSGFVSIQTLAENMLFDGKLGVPGVSYGWKYGPGSEGGIKIRRKPGSHIPVFNIIERMEDINIRVEELVALLDPSLVEEDVINDLFQYASRKWLLEVPEGNKDKLNLLSNADGISDLEMLCNAKLVQQLLENFKDILAAKPTQIIELVRQILEDFARQHKSQTSKAEGLINPTLGGLGDIVQQPTGGDDANGDASEKTEAENETISSALSLLSGVLTSTTNALSPKDSALLGRLVPSLQYISSTKSSSIPGSLTSAATRVTMLIELLAADPAYESGSTTINTMDEALYEDKKTLSLALGYLRDELVPVRAHGQSLLSQLISRGSAILDIPTIINLLLSLLQDEDEFIYLNAIKSLSLLARRHSKNVINVLVDRYVDKSEDHGLDQRLRIGEALERIVQELGELLVEDTAKKIGGGMMAVASRRGEKPKTVQEQQRRIAKEKRRGQEAQDAWGGEVPDIIGDIKSNKDNDIIEAIVDGWESKTGEEDIRVRSSALAILGTAVEVNIAGFPGSLLSESIDLSLSILTLETGNEQAILRRAAVLLTLGIVKALDRAQEEGKKLSFGFAGESLGDAIRVLSYVQGTDGDGMVRGHAEAVVEGMRIWEGKSIIGSRPAVLNEVGHEFKFGESGLQGISASLSGPSGSKPRIEEIE